MSRSAAAPVLEVRALSCGRTPPAFHDVDLVASAGEAVAVVGPSGGGKTALLRAVLGLDAPARGRVAWFGRRCRTTTDFRDARRRIGVVFADGALLGSERVDVNVAWGFQRRGAGADRPEVAALLDALALRPDATPDQLTPWERKRVGLARALVDRPEVLLLDGALDPATEARLDAVVAERYWPDVPLPTRIVFATSVPSSSMFSERLVLLGSGGTVVDGPRDEVLASPDPDVQLLLGSGFGPGS